MGKHPFLIFYLQIPGEPGPWPARKPQPAACTALKIKKGLFLPPNPGETGALIQGSGLRANNGPGSKKNIFSTQIYILFGVALYQLLRHLQAPNADVCCFTVVATPFLLGEY